MIEERRVRRTELRAPEAREEIQQVYGDVEGSFSEQQNMIQNLQDGRLRIPSSPVNNPSQGS